MKGVRFIADETHVPFIRVRKLAFVVSGLLMLASVGLFFTAGLNYGIDFRGGTLIEVRNKSGPADLADMRSKMSGIGLGDVQIQEFGEPEEVLIRIEQQPGGDAKQQFAIEKVKATLGRRC